MRGSKLWRGFVLGWVVLVGVGCWRLLIYDGRATGGVRDPAALRRIILEAVPVGSPVDSVWRFLEGEGFKQVGSIGRVERRDTDPPKVGFLRWDWDWHITTAPSDVFVGVDVIERDGRVADIRVGFSWSD